MISIDGVTWDIPCDITRVADISESEISGMLLDKRYFRDVIGTYMTYTVSMVVPRGEENSYSQIYEILTQPTASHVFVLPYNQDTLNLTAKVDRVQDVYIRLPGGGQTWRKTTFDIVAVHPTKELSLGDSIAHGIPEYPVNVESPIGALYEMTAGGWMRVYYDDADDIYY